QGGLALRRHGADGRDRVRRARHRRQGPGLRPLGRAGGAAGGGVSPLRDISMQSARSNDRALFFCRARATPVARLRSRSWPFPFFICKMPHMAVIAETLASLRFYGDDLDPEALTRQLGGPPSKSWRKGEVFGAKRTARRTGAWILNADRREPGDLDGQIDEIFSKLTHDLSVWRDLAGYRPDLFVGLMLEQSNEGIELNGKSLSLLADRGVRLGLDVYGPLSRLRNIQIVDGADNATFSIFQATNEEFHEIFPGPGQDMEI